MKTATALYLLALGQAMALPGPHSNRNNNIIDTNSTAISRRGTTDISSTNNARQITYQVNCNEMIEQTVGLISKYPDYAAKALGVGAGSGLAYNVCRALNQDRCQNWAGAVGSGLTLVVWWGKMVQDPAQNGEQTVTNTKRAPLLLLEGRDQHEWLRSELESHLVGRGALFDSVMAVPAVLSTRDGEMSHTLEVRGLQTRADEPAADHRLVLRDGGHGHLSIMSADARSVGQRANAPAFKIAWETVDAGSGVPEQAGYSFITDAAGKDWANRADGQDKIADYIGALEVGDAGSIQFRIIPEKAGFGENFEQVETCNA